MNSANHLQEALKLYDSGYQVIPLCTPKTQGEGCHHHGLKCAHPGKIPLVRWKDLTTVTHQEIQQWWRRWPDANIGALVSDGLVIVDVDPRNGGRDTAAALGIKPPETVTSLTGGGGEHWHFRDGHGIVSQTLGPGLEVLAEGKIAVLPPSLHASGRRYEWEVGSGPDDTAPAPVPDWLLKLSGAVRPKAYRPGVYKVDGGWDPVPPAPSHVRETLTRKLLSLDGEFQRDGRILAPCPFPDHQDAKPSFYYSPVTGRWWCFGGGHPGRKPGRVCVGGSAHQLESALDKATTNEMFISVINEVLPNNDYRNGHQVLSLERIEGVYHKMIGVLESRLESREWATFKQMETMNAISETLETALGGFITDRRPGGIRVPCLKDGVQEYVHVFPQGCGNPLCPIHSQAKAEENLRPKWKRLDKLREPALVLLRNTSSGPRQVAAKVAKLQRRKSCPVRDRGWYKVILPYRPGAQVGILVDLADGRIDLDNMKALWEGDIVLVRIPRQSLYEVIRELIRQVDFPEAYSTDEVYWLNWLLETRGLQCSRPIGPARKRSGEVEEEKSALCPHGNVYGKPIGMLTPEQMEVGLAEGLLEETSHGLIERREVPRFFGEEPPGMHKWKDRAMSRRRQREALAPAFSFVRRQ